MEWYPWKTYEKNYENRDAPMPIPGPPCVHCEHWQPRRKYIDIGSKYGKVFDGVVLCVKGIDNNYGEGQEEDFSCFSPKEESTMKAAPLGQPSKTLGDFWEYEEPVRSG